MYNPFHDIVKADELPPLLASRLFVPEASPIWSDVQNPINHLIVGPRGVGKTIVLKQLDYKSRADAVDCQGYLGIYIQISRVSTIFRNVFSTQFRNSNEPRNLFQLKSLFSDYLWLEILREIGSFLQNREDLRGSQAVSTYLSQITANGADSVNNLEEYCSNGQIQIETQIHQWSIDGRCTWEPLVDLVATLQRTALSLRRLVPGLNLDRPCLCLLLDESSPIPIECQEVLNGLLNRGRPYCVKLAVRPYEWTTLSTSVDNSIELETDVFPLHIHYPEELGNEYIAQMESVINRILEARITEEPSLAFGWPQSTHLKIHEILRTDCNAYPYSGFPAICAASSGNPQNLLLVLSCIISSISELSSDSKGLLIPPRVQHEAVKLWSRDYEDHNPYSDSRTFCRHLLKVIDSSSESEHQSIGFSFKEVEPDLFTSDYVPDDIGRIIQTGFSGGFLRNTTPEHTSLFDVPSRFSISRALLPRLDLDLCLPSFPEITIDRQFVERATREMRAPWMSGIRGMDKSQEERLTAFLSTSFSPALQQQRIDIKAELRKVAVDCVDVEDVSSDQFLFSSIFENIRDNDFTILDVTILRPYTMFEVGLCAGARKPRSVVCVVNDSGGSGVINGLQEFLHKLPIISFSFDSDRLARAAAQIRTRIDELRQKPSEFSKVALTGTSLRPRKRANTLFVSMPNDSWRERGVDAVRTKLEAKGWTVVVEEDAESYSANEFQLPISCAYMSRTGVIDTSGATEADFLQCYKLGLFAGKRRPWRVLHTEREENARPRTFASVPGIKYATWNSLDDFARIVHDFVFETKNRKSSG